MSMGGGGVRGPFCLYARSSAAVMLTGDLGPDFAVLMGGSGEVG